MLSLVGISRSGCRCGYGMATSFSSSVSGLMNAMRLSDIYDAATLRALQDYSLAVIESSIQSGHGVYECQEVWGRKLHQFLRTKTPEFVDALVNVVFNQNNGNEAYNSNPSQATVTSSSYSNSSHSNPIADKVEEADVIVIDGNNQNTERDNMQEETPVRANVRTDGSGEGIIHSGDTSRGKGHLNRNDENVRDRGAASRSRSRNRDRQSDLGNIGIVGHDFRERYETRTRNRSRSRSKDRHRDRDRYAFRDGDVHKDRYRDRDRDRYRDKDRDRGRDRYDRRDGSPDGKSRSSHHHGSHSSYHHLHGTRYDSRSPPNHHARRRHSRSPSPSTSNKEHGHRSSGHVRSRSPPESLSTSIGLKEINRPSSPGPRDPGSYIGRVPRTSSGGIDKERHRSRDRDRDRSRDREREIERGRYRDRHRESEKYRHRDEDRHRHRHEDRYRREGDYEIGRDRPQSRGSRSSSRKRDGHSGESRKDEREKEISLSVGNGGDLKNGAEELKGGDDLDTSVSQKGIMETESGGGRRRRLLIVKRDGDTVKVNRSKKETTSQEMQHEEERKKENANGAGSLERNEDEFDPRKVTLTIEMEADDDHHHHTTTDAHPTPYRRKVLLKSQRSLDHNHHHNHNQSNNTNAMDQEFPGARRAPSAVSVAAKIQQIKARQALATNNPSTPSSSSSPASRNRRPSATEVAAKIAALRKQANNDQIDQRSEIPSYVKIITATSPSPSPDRTNHSSSPLDTGR